MASNIHKYLVPGVAGFLGLTGLASGVYGLISPFEAVKVFGLYPPSTPSTDHAKAFEGGLANAYAIRNVGTGLSLISLLLFWSQQDDPVRREMVKKCLGLTMMLGTAVGLGDAWLINKFATRKGVVLNEQGGEKNAASGHAITAVVIGSIGGSLFFG